MPVYVRTGTLDLEQRVFVDRDGGEHTLTTTEASLLAHLARHIGDDVSRDDLLGEVWGHHAASLSRAVDTTVKRLRRKIEPADGPPQTLLTVHGVGYRLVGPAPAPVAAPAVEPRWLPLGHVDVDLDSGLMRGEGSPPPLTTQQLALLRTLADRPGQPVAASVLARRIGLAPHARGLLHTAVYRLRQAVEVDPSNPRLIVHLRGRGFLLAAEQEAPALVGVQRTLWHLARHAGTVLGFEDCVIYVRDGLHLVQTAAWGPKAPEHGRLVSPITLRMGQGIVGSAACRGGEVYVPDTSSDARYVPDAVAGRSELAVPIAFDGRVVGVIDSEARAAAAFDPRMRDALRSIAELAGTAAADVGRARRLAS